MALSGYYVPMRLLIRTRFLSALALVAFLLLAFPCWSAAETLKVIDSLGLTRASKQISAQASVTLGVKDMDGKLGAASVKLVNIDGLKPDVPGVHNGKGSFVFNEVSSGTWRIKFSKGFNATIVRVKISS